MDVVCSDDPSLENPPEECYVLCRHEQEFANGITGEYVVRTVNLFVNLLTNFVKKDTVDLTRKILSVKKKIIEISISQDGLMKLNEFQKYLNSTIGPEIINTAQREPPGVKHEKKLVDLYLLGLSYDVMLMCDLFMDRVEGNIVPFFSYYLPNVDTTKTFNQCWRFFMTQNAAISRSIFVFSISITSQVGGSKKRIRTKNKKKCKKRRTKKCRKCRTK